MSVLSQWLPVNSFLDELKRTNRPVPEHFRRVLVCGGVSECRGSEPPTSHSVTPGEAG